MNEVLSAEKAVSGFELRRYMRTTSNGKIRTGAVSRSGLAVKLTLAVLAGLTVAGFLTFDYKDIVLSEAVGATLKNIGTVFLSPRLKYDTFQGILHELLITFCLGILATIFGAIIAFFASLLCAKNIANPGIAAVVRSIVAFIRAVPTILWVLIFAVSAGLGSVAAVAGLTFHSAGYLIKVYSESIEEMDYGTIEALKACGAGFWPIVFQAIVPSSLRYMLAWTFMRFEINFTNAIAMGAAAGAGGIGYNLFMAGSFYFDMREMGFITYVVFIAVILLEAIATQIKAKVK
ncbi:PhnE/PtxC family ABC transporter permease [Papillibacter cinnamivorans]|uniref:Phosphonate transport system permease protein n=1 Tax=Papillibacter cinnamivorans DSM 12816 TaxID=1122930 RepID=A0A1W2BBC2_9FIRM|nr:ABC transporter permease subunit [Papillibacter cinnamivorans]SMC70111.1 phosphonate transport system permease protein [Papillibacter cinnamivorans DSM 12816]